MSRGEGKPAGENDQVPLDEKNELALSKVFGNFDNPYPEFLLSDVARWYDRKDPRITIRWNTPSRFLRGKEKKFLKKRMVTRIQIRPRGEPLAPVEVPVAKSNYSFDAEQDFFYTVQLKLMSVTDDGYETCIAEAWVAVLPNDMKDKFKAKPKFHWCDEISRAKSSEYWNDVRKNQNGILKKFKKDPNGHSENGIIGVLEGNFCGACKPNYEKIPSPYGKQVLKLKAHQYLNPSTFNWYFFDIYCYKAVYNYNCHSRLPPHYVNIAVCKKGSPADRKCAGKLKLLNPENNLFIMKKTFIEKNKNGSDTIKRLYLVNEDLWIELFITEDIDITNGKWTTVECNGRGNSAKEIRRNCPFCLAYFLKFLGKI